MSKGGEYLVIRAQFLDYCGCSYKTKFHYSTCLTYKETQFH